eukprot:TRINITY_DN2504_c0_g1_i5.p1 TRINITY_DN2504_c0_g1~~TRINITY_DN2504_c0_g1_i5.p1  ORF type:complete len:352 (+),score=61.40 TRINITY_DN2504_c0_g1_i5:1163-2218(+)
MEQGHETQNLDIRTYPENVGFNLTGKWEMGVGHSSPRQSTRKSLIKLAPSDPKILRNIVDLDEDEENRNKKQVKKQEREMGFFTNVPNEILVNILDVLDPASIVLLAETCKGLYSHILRENLEHTLQSKDNSPQTFQIRQSDRRLKLRTSQSRELKSDLPWAKIIHGYLEKSREVPTDHLPGFDEHETLILTFDLPPALHHALSMVDPRPYDAFVSTVFDGYTISQIQPSPKDRCVTEVFDLISLGKFKSISKISDLQRTLQDDFAVMNRHALFGENVYQENAYSPVDAKAFYNHLQNQFGVKSMLMWNDVKFAAEGQARYLILGYQFGAIVQWVRCDRHAERPCYNCGMG